MAKARNSIDPNSGFCDETKTFHSLRQPVLLPDPTFSLDITTFVLSEISSSFPSEPPNLALIDAINGQSLSYPDLRRRIETLATSLKTLNLSKGQTAFILSPSTIEIPVLYLSLLSIGVIVCPANPTSTASEIARLIKISNPQIAFTDSSNTYKIPPLKFPTIAIDSPEFAELASRPQSGHRRVTVNQEDPATILFSSGTTGSVKGVVLTHRNFIVAAAGIQQVKAAKRAKPAVLLLTSPVFHVYGFMVSVTAVAAGETLVLMRSFELGAMLKAVAEFKVTSVAAAPPVVAALAKSEAAAEYDLSSLEEVWCGGAPLRKEIINAFAVTFPGVPIGQVYGLTESALGVFLSCGPEECQRFGSSGKLMANFEVKIVDPVTSCPLLPCKHGELWVRGPAIMKGYICDEEATSSVLDSEGWLRTGDLCYIDNDGFLFVIDRLKDIIKYNGYQVLPAELEQLLQSHPEIVEAAVIPYPHDEVGQIPMAFVVRQHGSIITEKQVMDFIAKEVAPFKKIRRVSFINSIPKSLAGKILRKDLIRHTLSNSTS